MAELKDIQSVNKVETVGTVSEYNITINETNKKCEIDGEERTIKSANIYGTIVMDVDGQLIRHNLSALNTGKHTRKGNVNKVFEGIVTALGYDYQYDESTKKVVYTKSQSRSGLLPKMDSSITFKYLDKTVDKVKVKHSSEPSKVLVKGQLALTERLNRDKSDIAFYNNISINAITTNVTSNDDKCSYQVKGYINKIVDELAQDMTATGRATLELIVPTFFGIDVFPLIINKSWVEENDGETFTFTKKDFCDFFKEGDTVVLNGDIIRKTIGAKVEKSSNSFGAKANVTSGFTIDEWNIRGGDKLSDEGSIFEKDKIAVALNEYATYCDARYKKLLEDDIEYNKTKSSTTTSNTGSLGGFGAKAKVETLDDDDLPFDMDDDEDPFN